MVPRPHAGRSTGHSVVIAGVDKVSCIFPLSFYSVLTDIDSGRYIKETIELDRKNFKPVPHVNPFLNDFIDDGAYMDDSGASGGVAQVGLAGLVDIL